MTSNAVAMRDVMEMCFTGFSSQIRLVAMAESVGLFTHCYAIKLSVATNLLILNQRMEAGIFFWPEQGKIFYAVHVCVST